MIKEKVLKLKEDVELNHGLKFKKNDEFNIVMDVVYMGGFMLPPEHQKGIYLWIVQNPNLFEDVTRNW